MDFQSLKRADAKLRKGFEAALADVCFRCGQRQGLELDIEKGQPLCDQCYGREGQPKSINMMRLNFNIQKLNTTFSSYQSRKSAIKGILESLTQEIEALILLRKAATSILTEIENKKQLFFQSSNLMAEIVETKQKLIAADKREQKVSLFKHLYALKKEIKTHNELTEELANILKTKERQAKKLLKQLNAKVSELVLLDLNCFCSTQKQKARTRVKLPKVVSNERALGDRTWVIKEERWADINKKFRVEQLANVQNLYLCVKSCCYKRVQPSQASIRMTSTSLADQLPVIGLQESTVITSMSSADQIVAPSPASPA